MTKGLPQWTPPSDNTHVEAEWITGKVTPGLVWKHSMVWWNWGGNDEAVNGETSLLDATVQSVAGQILLTMRREGGRGGAWKCSDGGLVAFRGTRWVVLLLMLRRTRREGGRSHLQSPLWVGCEPPLRTGAQTQDGPWSCGWSYGILGSAAPRTGSYGMRSPP